MTDTLRTTFRFNASEADFAARLRRPGSDEARAVRELTGYEDLTHAPAATLLHTIVEAGIHAIREQTEKVRHERLAEFLKDDPEHRAWRESRAARRARRFSQQESA
jgi:hypothetical protein